MMDARHSSIIEIIALWQRLSPGPGLLPGRKHFDPLDVPRLLPNIWLLDVVAGTPRRYRVRLVGGAIMGVGFPAKPGEFFDDENVTFNVPEIRRQLDAIVDSRIYHWRRGPPAIEHSKHVDTLERVILPLASDGRAVDMLLGLTVFYWKDGQPRG